MYVQESEVLNVVYIKVCTEFIFNRSKFSSSIVFLVIEVNSFVLHWRGDIHTFSFHHSPLHHFLGHSPYLHYVLQDYRSCRPHFEVILLSL